MLDVDWSDRGAPAFWLATRDSCLIPLLFAYISMKWRSIGETDKMFSIEKIQDLHKIASPVFLSFPGSHQCAVVNILTGIRLFSKSLMLWSFGIVILTSCIDIVLSKFHSNKRVKSAVAWLSPCLSWWLIPQLSCYHPWSVKRWGWNDDDHIQRCQAFKEIQILDTVWILLTLQFTICQW